MELEIKKMPVEPGQSTDIDTYRCTANDQAQVIEIDAGDRGLSMDLPDDMQTPRGGASIEMEADLTNPQFKEATIRIMANAAFQLIAAQNNPQQ